MDEEILRQLLASALHLAGGGSLLPTMWESIIPTALEKGKADVRGILHGRGYSDAKIDAWPGYVATVQCQAAYWALIIGGGLQDANSRFVEMLDQREALTTLSIEAFPDGPCGWGRIRSESAFLEPDPEQELELVDQRARRVFKPW